MAVQSDYRYSLNANGSTQFDVVHFVLKEHLSSLFCLELDLAGFGAVTNLNEFIDQPATLTFWQGTQAVRHINGIITSFNQAETGFTRTRYRMVIEPSLYASSNNKILNRLSKRCSIKIGSCKTNFIYKRLTGHANIVCNIVKPI